MKDSPIIELRTGAGDDERRLDRVLRKALPDLPLSRIHRLLREGKVLLDGKRAGAELRVRAGQLIRLPAGNTGSRPAGTQTRARPGQPELKIVFESPDLLALNKPAGLAVHGPQSLDAQLRAYLAPRLPPSLSFSPGPLHRLDQPTSGIVVFSASLEGARSFSALIRKGVLVKRYLALVEGLLDAPGLWEDELLRDRAQRKTLWAGTTGDPTGDPAGKTARTRYRPLASRKGFSLLELELDTGRTHQIRAQAAAHHHPLAGDRKYGSATDLGISGISFLLHAWQLEFPSGSSPALLEAPLPDYFRKKAGELFGVEWETFSPV
jgi:23S rRNA pseudouridine955/2504/2580 synthase